MQQFLLMLVIFLHFGPQIIAKLFFVFLLNISTSRAEDATLGQVLQTVTCLNLIMCLFTSA